MYRWHVWDKSYRFLDNFTHFIVIIYWCLSFANRDMHSAFLITTFSFSTTLSWCTGPASRSLKRIRIVTCSPPRRTHLSKRSSCRSWRCCTAREKAVPCSPWSCRHDGVCCIDVPYDETMCDLLCRRQISSDGGFATIRYRYSSTNPGSVFTYVLCSPFARGACWRAFAAWDKESSFSSNYANSMVPNELLHKYSVSL